MITLTWAITPYVAIVLITYVGTSEDNDAAKKVTPHEALVYCILIFSIPQRTSPLTINRLSHNNRKGIKHPSEEVCKVWRVVP